MRRWKSPMVVTVSEIGARRPTPLASASGRDEFVCLHANGYGTALKRHTGVSSAAPPGHSLETTKRAQVCAHCDAAEHGGGHPVVAFSAGRAEIRRVQARDRARGTVLDRLLGAVLGPLLW